MPGTGNFTYTFMLDYPVDPNTEQMIIQSLRQQQLVLNNLLAAQQGRHHGGDRAGGQNGIPSPPPPPVQHQDAWGQKPTGGAVIADEPPRAFNCIQTYQPHAAPVHSIDVSPDNTRIASASWDATVSIYNLQTRAYEATLQNFSEGPLNQEKNEPLWESGEMGGLYCVKFARSIHHSNILGCASADHMVYLWNFNPGSQSSPQVTMRLKGHIDEVNCIDFHPQQAVVCSTSDDCDAIVWDMDSGVTLRTLQKHPRAVYGAAFLGQDQEYLVATVCFDQKTRVYDMRDKQVVAQLQGHTDDVIGIDYTDKSLLATGSDDGMIVIWDVRTWQCVSKINTREFAPDNEVKRVKFSKSRSKVEIAAGGSNNTVYIFDLDLAKTNVTEPTFKLDGHEDCVFDVAWGVNKQDNKTPFLVTASHDRSWKFWGP